MSQLKLEDYNGYAFDFDGTIADTIGTHTLARQQAFASMAELTGDQRFTQISPELQEEAHRHGSNPTAIIGWVLQASGVVKDSTDKLVAQTVDMKRERYAELCRSGLSQTAGAVELVQYLGRIAPGREGITTTAYRDAEVLPFLRRYDLLKLIADDLIITHEDVGPDHLKPHPLAYQITLERFNMTHTPNKLLVFEDTPGGVASAKAAHATVVAVCNTHNAESFDVADAGLCPDYVIPSFVGLAP
jgi:beta-phosphoglucomutase-like phosphatase (HAD superfamily)